MKLQFKIFILLILTIGIIITAFAVYQLIQIKQKRIFEIEAAKSDDQLINQVIKIKSLQFGQLVNDYSGWDDMLNFAHNPDSTWAEINIDVLVSTYKLDLCFVYNLAKESVYSVRDSSKIRQNIVFEPHILTAAFQNKPICHFFIYFGNELYEVYGATIVPSDDMVDRKTPPNGYLILVKQWNKTYLDEFALATNFKIELSKIKDSLAVEKPANTDEVFSLRKLSNNLNVPIANIRFIKPNTLKQELKSFAKISIIITIITGITIIIFLIVFQRMVILPLSLISNTLNSDDINLLKPLLKKTGEFNKLAVLIIDFFIQKITLQSINAELKETNDEVLAQNEMLNQQKDEISAQSENIEQAYNEISTQKEKIEKSHTELTANIQYALRLQNALLPQKKDLKRFFDKHFVFYKPRNVVSGDFYWVNRIDNNIIFVTADCTGHGVTGAFMSVLGISSLNEIFAKLIQHGGKNIAADEILNMLREQIMNVLHQTNELGTTKDGMDAAVCIFNLETSEMQFAGANMSVIVVQNNELLELKPNKMPIGIHPKAMNTFSNQRITLDENAMVYAFSDGFFDQIGGEKKRKYLRRNFRVLLNNIYTLPVEQQLKIVENEFKTWKKTKPQTDDVLVIGIQSLFNKSLISNQLNVDWSSYSILVAEDSEISYLYLNRVLSAVKAKLTWVKTGVDAVNMLKNTPAGFNIVLMDLQMPVMNGYEAIVEIRKFNKQIPIIVQTAYNVLDEKTRSFEAGCTDYISKPYSENEIIATISKHIGS